MVCKKTFVFFSVCVVLDDQRNAFRKTDFNQETIQASILAFTRVFFVH